MKNFIDENWSTEYDGSLVIDGQVIGLFGPDYATRGEKIAISTACSALPQLLRAAESARELAGSREYALEKGNFALVDVIDELDEAIEKARGKK